MPRLFTRLALTGLIGFVSACASISTSTPPVSVRSELNAAAGDVRPRPAPRAALRAARPEGPGYAIKGATFDADLIFEERDGRPVITYFHDVAGVPTVIAELDLAEDWLTDGVQRFVGRSDRGLDIEVEMVSGPCEVDGRTLARFAQVHAGRTRYEGCAAETGSVISWSERLPGFLDSVAACEAEAAGSAMAFVRGGGGHIIHARVQDGAQVLRYRFGDRGRWECSVEGERARWSVVTEQAEPMPGEGEPVFAPGRLPPPGENCYLYERVQSADGALLGGLGQDVCSGDMAGGTGEPPFG